MAFESNIYAHDPSAQILNTQGASGDVLSGLVSSAAGNVAGGLFNASLNYALQENQFENQRALQDAAYAKNERAVQNQARLQALGMQQAGLSAAQVNGQGAPSLQSGAAAGASSQMSSVFAGLAELVAAIKAPSEIEKTVAEAGLAAAGVEKTKAESEHLIPAQVTNLIESTGKLSEEIRSLGNMNDVYEAQLRFVKDHGPAVIEGNNAMLKAAGIFDKLPEKTKETLTRMEDGSIEIGLGELEGLHKVVDEQSNLMVKDKELFTSALDTIVAINQIKDKSVLTALQKMPVTTQNLMKAEISDYYALANQARTQADLNELNKWLGEHTSDQWLIEHGMSDEIERKKYSELLNQILAFPGAVVRSVPFIAGGAAASSGRSVSKLPVDSRGLYEYFK